MLHHFEVGVIHQLCTPGALIPDFYFCQQIKFHNVNSLSEYQNRDHIQPNKNTNSTKN